MARKAVALAFIALQGLVALALFVFSVHGPAGLAAAAPIYFAVAAALTWWAGRKSWALLCIAGIAMLAAAPGIYGLLDLVGRKLEANRIAGTLVADVRDAPILSAGLPVGMRLSYAVTVPATGHFAILPSVNGSGAAQQLDLQSRRWTFDGRPGPDFGPFQTGKQHQVVVDLYPAPFAFDQKGADCLQLTTSRPLPEPGKAAPLRVYIWDTPYGYPDRGGREERTRGEYDLPALYRNVLAAGLPACKVGP